MEGCEGQHRKSDKKKKHSKPGCWFPNRHNQLKNIWKHIIMKLLKTCGYDKGSVFVFHHHVYWLGATVISQLSMFCSPCVLSVSRVKTPCRNVPNMTKWPFSVHCFRTKNNLTLLIFGLNYSRIPIRKMYYEIKSF